MSHLNNTYQNNDEQLIKYLEGKLSGEELYEFEKQMSDSSMLDDAVEGLNNIKNKHKIDNYVNDLNKHLHEYISTKKKRRLKNKLELNDWTLLSIFLVITLCVVAYCVIKTIR
jgi:ABC-type bacteriocin/lantibiotic exporter with double-glycine peptidase domain